jgi:hypothetical protein
VLRLNYIKADHYHFEITYCKRNHSTPLTTTIQRGYTEPLRPNIFQCKPSTPNFTKIRSVFSNIKYVDKHPNPSSILKVQIVHFVSKMWIKITRIRVGECIQSTDLLNWKGNFDKQVGGSVCLRMTDQALQVLRFTWQDPGITKENPTYCNLKQHTGVSDRKFTHWGKKWVKATFIANISSSTPHIKHL